MKLFTIFAAVFGISSGFCYLGFDDRCLTRCDRKLRRCTQQRTYYEKQFCWENKRQSENRMRELVKPLSVRQLEKPAELLAPVKNFPNKIEIFIVIFLEKETSSRFFFLFIFCFQSLSIRLNELSFKSSHVFLDFARKKIVT